MMVPNHINVSRRKHNTKQMLDFNLIDININNKLVYSLLIAKQILIYYGTNELVRVHYIYKP